MDSDFAGDPVSRESTTGLVARIGNHTVKSGSTLQSFTALSVGEAEFYAVVKEGQVGLSLRSENQDLGLPMKIETQSDRSTANSLTDRLGAGQCTKHIGTQVCRIGILLTTESTLHYKMQETRTQKHTVVSVDREHRDGCAS